MEYEVIQHEDYLVIEIHDEINFENSKDLKNIIKGNSDLSQYNQYIIDLEHVNFIDSSGLGTLVSLLTYLKKSNGSLLLVNINENIEELFKLTRLNEFFEIYQSIDEAVASLTE